MALEKPGNLREFFSPTLWTACYCYLCHHLVREGIVMPASRCHAVCVSAALISSAKVSSAVLVLFSVFSFYMLHTCQFSSAISVLYLMVLGLNLTMLQHWTDCK